MDDMRKYIRKQGRDIMLLAIVAPVVFLSVLGAMYVFDQNLAYKAKQCQEACVKW